MTIPEAQKLIEQIKKALNRLHDANEMLCEHEDDIEWVELDDAKTALHQLSAYVAERESLNKEIDNFDNGWFEIHERNIRKIAGCHDFIGFPPSPVFRVTEREKDMALAILDLKKALAEQEKAARVKALEELKTSIPGGRTWSTLGERLLPEEIARRKGYNEYLFEIIIIIDQKIKEAGK